MKNLLFILILFLIIISCTSKYSGKMGFEKLDQGYISAKDIFSEGLISQKDRFEQNITFSKDGNLCLVGLSDSIWNYKGLLKYKLDGKNWRLEDTMNFGFEFIGEAIFAPKNNKLFIVAYTPEEGKGFQTDIYTLNFENDSFYKPVLLDSNVLSDYSEWHPSIAENGNIYFSSERRGEGKIMSDIYVSKFEDGKYKEAVRLKEPLNTDFNDSDPLISPDESYLIVQSDRDGGYGKHDFYVSFKNSSGEWLKPMNLGSEINTEEWEIGPSFSPDYKYILFTRRKEWKTDESSNIYRFSVEQIESLRYNKVAE